MLSAFLKRLIHRSKLKRVTKEGIVIGKDTLVFLDPEAFGSEPYLTHIGSKCIISKGVTFINHDGAIRVIRKKEEYSNINNKYGKIDIRDNVYIGENSIIMPNVTIGPNACVLPGSVVYRDIPPDSIAAGNPASVQNKIDNFLEYYNNELYPYYKKNY